MRSAIICVSLSFFALTGCEVDSGSSGEEEGTLHDIYLYADDGDEVFVGQYNVETGQILDAVIDHPAFYAGVLMSTDDESLLLSGTEAVSTQGFDLPLGTDLRAQAWINEDGEPIDVGTIQIDEMVSQRPALNTDSFCSYSTRCKTSGSIWTGNYKYLKCRTAYCRGGGKSESCWQINVWNYARC